MYIREEYLGQNLGVLFTAVEYRTKGKNCGMEAERWKYFITPRSPIWSVKQPDEKGFIPPFYEPS